MAENKLVFNDEGKLNLAINNMLIDLSNLFATTYYTIDSETLSLTTITFNYTIMPSEDMTDVILAVHNSLSPEDEFVKVISVNKLAELTKSCFSSGVFLGNSSDMYAYLKGLVHGMYKKFLKSRYIMLDDIFSRSNCIVSKNNKAILTVEDRGEAKEKFFAVAAFDPASSDNLNPLIYMNLKLQEAYYSFYENPYDVFMGIDANKPGSVGDAANSKYELVFVSPNYKKMLILELGYKNSGFTIKKIKIEEDYNGLRDVVLIHYNDLPEILDIAADLSDNTDIADLLDFLD